LYDSHRYLLDNARFLLSDYADILYVDLRDVDVVWNLRFTRSIARAVSTGESRVIELGRNVYPHVGADQRPEVIAHEVCHHATWVIWGDRIKKPHGPEWKALMNALGFLNPSIRMEFGSHQMKGGLPWPVRRAPRERQSG